MIEALSLLMAPRQLQAFLTPQSFDLLVIDAPAFNTQEFGDLAISVAAILLG